MTFFTIFFRFGDSCMIAKMIGKLHFNRRKIQNAMRDTYALLSLRLSTSNDYIGRNTCFKINSHCLDIFMDIFISRELIALDDKFQLYKQQRRRKRAPNFPIYCCLCTSRWHSLGETQGERPWLDVLSR